MDALWSLEDKWKISTQKAVVLLVCTVILVILASTATIVMILKKKGRRNQIASLDSDNESESSSLVMYQNRSSSSKCTFFVKNVIVASPCWSMAHRWNSDDFMSNCMKFSSCLGSKLQPVWQRPILMGEKCEFPRFSGLILYDERGRPLPHHNNGQRQLANEAYDDNHVGQLMEHYQDLQEDAHVVCENTLLKDLL